MKTLSNRRLRWVILLIALFLVSGGYTFLKGPLPPVHSALTPSPTPSPTFVLETRGWTSPPSRVQVYARVRRDQRTYTPGPPFHLTHRVDVPLPPDDAYGLPPLPHVITYTVQPGDTLSTIALHFGVSLDSLRWSNPDIGHNPDDIYPGQVLYIPPINGVVVKVKPGDTVEKLAQRFHVPPDVIRTYAANRLRPPYKLTPGALIVIPGGHREIRVAPPKPYPGYAYMWPVRGVITQRFHKRHPGLDIATAYGAGVYAARAGRVRAVGWDDTGYGYMIILDHGGGWNTLYAHLKGALVKPGQWVNQGDLIARVGGTGRATGPHIHFEIRKGRVRYDPAKFLPPSP